MTNIVNLKLNLLSIGNKIEREIIIIRFADIVIKIVKIKSD